MKKCFKCGNSVLPGTSTCPGCGNPIRNNTNTRQSFTPTSVKTADYTPRRVHDTVSPNTRGYSSNGAGTGVVVIIIFMFVLMPIVFTFSFIKNQINEFEETSEELFENVETENTNNPGISSYELYDYVKLNEVVKSENGEIVMFLENTYTEQLNVDMDLKYLDENGSELSGRFGVMDIAPGVEQVMVFTKSPVAYRAYKYGYDVMYSEMLDSATTIDVEKVVTNDNGEKLVATYTNDSEDDLERVELCVFYYDNETLKYVECGRDYDIARGEDLIIEFDYSSMVRFHGLTFNRYEYHLHEAEKE